MFKIAMGVSWYVKVVYEWYRECEKKGLSNCDKEAFRKFGYWRHEASHGSCYELWEKADEYFEKVGLDYRYPEYLDVNKFFCWPFKGELDYNEKACRLLKEALRYAEENINDEFLKLHAKFLIKLIETAEKLKSGIICI